MFSTELTAIAIDDEWHALKDLEMQLLQVENLQLLGSFKSTEPALDFLKGQGGVNIVFCDIEMPSVNGIDAASSLSAYTDHLIFVTGHPQYALRAFEVGADAFLTKPVCVDEVQGKVDKLCKLLKNAGPVKDVSGNLFVRDGLKKVDHVVALGEIIELCCNGNYVDIITAQKTVTEHISLRAWEKSLEKTGRFIRVNRSVIVSKEFIDYIQENIVYLKNGQHYAIGRTYQKSFCDYKKMNRRDNLMG